MNDPTGAHEAAGRRPRVRSRVAGRRAEVVLDFPSKLNVLDREGWEELRDAFASVADQPHVRVVSVLGAGTRGFSAGSDIGAFPSQRKTPDQVREYGAAIHGALSAIAECPLPTLAVIEGVCVGGGLEIAACCDLRVCGTSSRFGAPIARLGLTMAYEELRPLIQALGPGPVLELLLTGDLIGAERAMSLGFANRVVADGAVAEVGEALAERIAAGAPLVHRWHKRFVRRLRDPRDLSDAERAEAYEAFRTEDYQEGTLAFQEKREPRFKGR